MIDVFAETLMGMGCFSVLEANHTIEHSKFTDLYKLIWFYQTSSIFELKWINSEFSGGNVEMFLNNERYEKINKSLVIVESCGFYHINSIGEFLFKWLSSNITFSNTTFENLTLSSSTARAWLKIDQSNLLVENCTFKNCGFTSDSSDAPKLYDKSLLNHWSALKNQIVDSIFIIDRSLYLQGGFVNIYFGFDTFNISNSVFKVTEQSISGWCKGVVATKVPVVNVWNTSFINLRCASRGTNILQENGGGLLILGNPSYTSKETNSNVITINIQSSIILIIFRYLRPV
jgi:hypothetical protein